MGKPSWANNIWGKKKQGHGAADSSSSWDWGSWDEQSWQTWTKGNGKHKTDKRHAFPQYQDMQINGESKDSLHLTTEDEEEGVDDIKQIQKYINSIRKSEARGRKILELRTTREQQWKAFQEELQKTFADQKKKYKMDVQKLDADLKEAQKQKEEATFTLKQYVGSGRSTATPATPTLIDKEDMEEWAALTADPTPTQQSIEVDPWMQDMFQHTALGGGGITMEERSKLSAWLDRQDAVLTTPTRPTTGGTPRTPMSKAPSTGGPLALRPFKSKALGIGGQGNGGPAVAAPVGHVAAPVSGQMAAVYAAGHGATSDPYMRSPACNAPSTAGIGPEAQASGDRVGTTPTPPRTNYGSRELRSRWRRPLCRSPRQTTAPRKP